MLLGVSGFGVECARYPNDPRCRGRRNNEDCEACLGSRMTCAECKQNGACVGNECKSSHHFRGFAGLDDITGMAGDAFNTITSCGFIPILAGFAAGYFAKKMRWI